MILLLRSTNHDWQKVMYAESIYQSFFRSIILRYLLTVQHAASAFSNSTPYQLFLVWEIVSNIFSSLDSFVLFPNRFFVLYSLIHSEWYIQLFTSSFGLQKVVLPRPLWLSQISPPFLSLRSQVTLPSTVFMSQAINAVYVPALPSFLTIIYFNRLQPAKIFLTAKIFILFYYLSPSFTFTTDS